MRSSASVVVSRVGRSRAVAVRSRSRSVEAELAASAGLYVTVAPLLNVSADALARPLRARASALTFRRGATVTYSPAEAASSASTDRLRLLTATARDLPTRETTTDALERIYWQVTGTGAQGFGL